ncbi:MAG TPA: glycosyltransferase [Rhodocyclaceae bacterium]
MNRPTARPATRPAAPSRDMAAPVAVVVLTHNRRREVLRTMARLAALPEAPPLCVVDNGSGDGTAVALARRFPQVRLVHLEHNAGAAGRNAGAQAVHADYVAFCDDDTWWAPGSLAEAVRLLDEHAGLAVVTARVLVGSREREDPTCAIMAASPVPAPPGFPGTAVVGFLAGACVMRRSAFLLAGGFEPRLLIGGEEALLALDLMAAGWWLGYAPALVVHHHPSTHRDSLRRRQLLLRNALWCAWLRRPARSAWRETRRRLREARRDPQLLRGVAEAIAGLPWTLASRRVIPPTVERQLQRVEAA